MWADDILNGSMMAEGTLEDIGFMTAMVCLAVKCRGDYGWIQANPECPFQHQWIANRITGGDLDKFERLLHKMVAEERLTEVADRGIFVCNMEYYQVTKGAKDVKNSPDGNGSKPKFAPLPTSQTIQDGKDRKRAAELTVTQQQTVIDQLAEQGLRVSDKHTGVVMPTRYDKESD